MPILAGSGFPKLNSGSGLLPGKMIFAPKIKLPWKKLSLYQIIGTDEGFGFWFDCLLNFDSFMLGLLSGQTRIDFKIPSSTHLFKNTMFGNCSKKENEFETQI